MEITLTSMLSLFALLIVASLVFVFSRKLTIPYTVLLVLIGIVIVPFAQSGVLNGFLGFIDDMKLTPELLFFIFLPILIFESAYNMRIRHMVDSAWSISVLSIGGLLISAFLIAGLLYVTLPLIGITIPFIVALLFGSIISATDPVAVLALFKEYGAPKRLTMIFEGESLFNDGTAVALFMVVLAIIVDGFHGGITVVEGLMSFIVMVFGGIIFGLAAAGLFTRLLRKTRANVLATSTLLLISAHVVFILSEAINEYGIFGLEIHVSSIIATTVSSVFLGNHARHVLTHHTDEYIEKAIEHMAYVANSLVFLLSGILFASSGVDIAKLWLPIVVTVGIVAVVRIASVYMAIIPINLFVKNEYIPPAWRVLLSWGSLRGALAIIVVLLVPENLTVPGWSLEYSVRDFVLALTIGCVLATLFIKTPLIAPLMRRLHVIEEDPLKMATEADLEIYYLLNEKMKLEKDKTRGFVNDEHYKSLKEAVNNRLESAYAHRESLVKQYGRRLFVQALNVKAIRIERHVLKQLYRNHEINEESYRRISSKLNLQQEKIEYDHMEDIDPSASIDRKDIFDRVMRAFHGYRTKSEISNRDKLQYYRAQMVMARQSNKELDRVQGEFTSPVFMPDVLAETEERYKQYQQQTAEKIDALLERYADELAPYLAELIGRSISASGIRALERLRVRGVATDGMEDRLEGSAVGIG